MCVECYEINSNGSHLLRKSSPVSQRPRSAAARHSSISSAANPRSRFVASSRRVGHVLTHVASACRVSSRLRTRTCAARLEKPPFRIVFKSNEALAVINTAQSAIESVVCLITFADGRITATEFSTLQYDAASRITGITQNLWASRTVTQTVGTETAIVTELYQAPFSWSAGYDNRNRLTSFNRAGSEQSYTYDANSNRLTSIAKKVSDTDIDGIFEATDRAATTAQTLNIAQTSNKLLGFNQSVLTQATAANGTRRTISNVISQINYQLDANGNLTSDGLRTFDYNAENRLEKVQITQSGEAAKITYLHNAAGQRVFKSEPQSAQTLPNEAELGTTFVDWLKKNFSWLYAQAQTNATLGTSYTYGEGQLPSWAITGEYGNGGATSTGRTEYIWLPTDDGSAIPVAMFRNNRYYNIHSDHLGTPRIVTDDQAKPVWQWAYSAFGDNKPTGILKATTNPNAAITNQPVLLQATTPATVLNLRMPGQTYDVETGLAQNFMREYMSSQGRYTQSDPTGLYGGSNRFAYANQTPLNSSDPNGEIVMVLPFVWGGSSLASWATAGVGAGALLATVGSISGSSNSQGEADRSIWQPDKVPGNWVCKARADCNDNIPGNCPTEPDKRFAFGGGIAKDLGLARNTAKANATSNLMCQPKHVSCKCTGPKGEAYSGGC
jgi:RHS repeat-associated protein